VRLVRTERSLLVLGPGTERTELAFEDDDVVDSLQRQIEANLRRQGWVFEGYAVERRCGKDRRQVSGWSERRQHRP
jgi:hypothetical protein